MKRFLPPNLPSAPPHFEPPQLTCADCSLPELEGCLETYCIVRTEDPRAPAARCANFLHRLAEQRMANAGIPAICAGLSFADLRTTGIRGGRQMAANVHDVRCAVDSWVTWRNNPAQCWPPRHAARSGLLFHGPAGTGKSALAAVALRTFLERTSGSGRWLSLPAHLAAVQAAIDGTERPNLTSYLLADLLVVDELGSRRRTPFVDDETYLLVAGRYDSGKPTLFTTNHAPDELEKHVGPRVFSRLHEMCEPWLSFSDLDDHRKKKPLTRKAKS